MLEAKNLFPEQKEHFAERSVQNLELLSTHGLPYMYTYVYWNVWDNWLFDDPEQKQCLKKAYASVSHGGRLILGFYDKEPNSIQTEIAQAGKVLSRAFERIGNSPRREITIWFDRNVES